LISTLWWEIFLRKHTPAALQYMIWLVLSLLRNMVSYVFLRLLSI
jgi:hypothetical protein